MTELIVQASTFMIELMVQEEMARKEFSRRLALACDEAGLPSHGRQAYIAEKLNLTPKAVSKWFNGESIPRRGKSKELASVIGVSATYLLGDDKDDRIAIPHAKKSSNTYQIDVLDIEASAGNGCLVSREVGDTISSIVYDSEKALEIFGHRPAESIKVITVTGDSMSGTIETGDYIFVDVSKNYFDGDGIYVFSFKNAVMVKRLQFTADGLLVKSDNQKYSDWLINKHNEQYLKVAGRVLSSHSISRYT